MLQLLVVVLLQLALNVPCRLFDGFVQVCVLRLPLADDALVRDLDDDLDFLDLTEDELEEMASPDRDDLPEEADDD